MADYDRGDTAALSLSVRNAAGAAADPAALTLTLIAPDATSTTYTYGVDALIVRTALGEFTADPVLSQNGAWSYDWRATNPTQVQGGELIVGLPTTERAAAERKARRRLVAWLDPDTEPVLGAAEVDDLLERARVADAAGLYPSEAGYVPTWSTMSLHAAAREGWTIKLGRCTSSIDFGEDGQSFRQSQEPAHIRAMIRLHSCGSGSVTISSVVA